MRTLLNLEKKFVLCYLKHQDDVMSFALLRVQGAD